MSDGEILWLAFVVVYLGECCFWVRRGRIAFHLPWNTTAGWSRPASFAGNQQGGVLLANPLPPLGTVLICAGTRLDTGAIAERWEFYRHTTVRLRVACVALWVALFVGGALLVWLPGAHRLMLALVVAVVVLMVWINLEFWRAHRAFFPARRGDRLLHTFTHGIFPPSALRAQDTLTRDLLAEFHPVAVGKVLCKPAVWRALVQRTLLEGRYPIDGESSDSQPRPFEELAKFAGQHGLSVADLLAPPARTEELCQSYCPRCRTQYNVPTGHCSDCQGVKLEPLLWV
jgi:hypothetical protein